MEGAYQGVNVKTCVKKIPIVKVTHILAIIGASDLTRAIQLNFGKTDAGKGKMGKNLNHGQKVVIIHYQKKLHQISNRKMNNV